MANLNMNGNYKLDTETITKILIGNHTLCYIKCKIFDIKYLGCSYSDLKARLSSYVLNWEYKECKYSCATLQKAVFEKECQKFYDFGETEKLDNNNHHDRLNSHGWKCSIFDK